MKPLAALGVSLLGLTAGAALAFQAVVNSQLRGLLGSALRASFVSYVGGVVCCISALLIVREPLAFATSGMRDTWYLWTGGAHGLIYIALAIWLIPRIGGGGTLALIVAGQLIAAVLFDHFGVLGVVRRPLDLVKVAGVALLVAGAVLIRR